MKDNYKIYEVNVIFYFEEYFFFQCQEGVML